MPVTISGVPGVQANSDGVQQVVRAGKTGELLVSEFQGRYYENAYRKNLFTATAIVTAPVIFSTAAGTGGPLLWNGSVGINAVLIAIGFGQTVSSTVAAAIGLTGGVAQPSAPTATTAIDSKTNNFIGGAASQATAFRVGTPAVAGLFFIPFADVDTGALTTGVGGVNWVELAGGIIVPPGAWASVAASATATTLVAQIALMWAEVPV